MKRKHKKTSAQQICELLNMPAGTVGRVSFIEAAGNRELEISGCDGLLEYSDERIVMVMCDGRVTVCGEELVLHRLSEDRVSVSGVISRISYGDTESGDED